MGPGGGKLRFSTLSVTLFSFMAAAILTLSFFPPAVRTTPASSTIMRAKKVEILLGIVSGYATINQGADHIAAISKPALEWVTNEPMNRIYPGLGRIPIIGTDYTPDPEQVLWLQPDAVFVNSWQAPFLKKLGLPGLIECKYDEQNPIGSREEMWSVMGDVTGKSVRAEALAKRYVAKRMVLRRRFPSDIERQVRVVYVHVDHGIWWTTNREYYLAYKLELAGAINVSKDLRFADTTDLEQLLLLDPDVILFATKPGDHTTMQEVVRRPEFQSLRAVREHRIYKLPAHTYMNDPVEDPLLLRWMAEVFYPDGMSSGLREEYKETYHEVYGYAISDDEIDRAISP
jgi:iron complex transport system substrate-binding protein